MSHLHHNNAWTRLSRRFLKRHPLCADPFGYHAKTGRYAPSTQSHHIVHVDDAPDRMLDESNLMALCDLCHDVMHLRIDAVTKMLHEGVSMADIASAVASRQGSAGKG